VVTTDDGIFRSDREARGERLLDRSPLQNQSNDINAAMRFTATRDELFEPAVRLPEGGDGGDVGRQAGVCMDGKHISRPFTMMQGVKVRSPDEYKSNLRSKGDAVAWSPAGHGDAVPWAPTEGRRAGGMRI